MEGFTSGKALPDPARKPTAPGTVFPGGRKGGRKAIRPIRAWEQLRWRWSKDKKRMDRGSWESVSSTAKPALTELRVLLFTAFYCCPDESVRMPLSLMISFIVFVSLGLRTIGESLMG
jgi:hypothetical protein